MRRFVWWTVTVLAMTLPAFSAAHSSHARTGDGETENENTAFKAGGLKFYMPPKWIAEPAGTPARAGQWRVTGLRGQAGQIGDDGHLVAFFFGPGKGGASKQTIDAWIGTMFNVDGHPAAAEVKNRQANGCKVSQVVVFGTYSEPVPIAGIPPVSKPGYGLIGTVVENPKGNIYWRFTGPEPLITANILLFNKMIDSMRPETR